MITNISDREDTKFLSYNKRKTNFLFVFRSLIRTFAGNRGNMIIDL